MLLRQAYCRLFVSLTTASCTACLYLTDRAYCMLLRQAYCRLFVSLLWLPSLLLCGLLIRIAACFLGRLAAACLSALQRLLSPLICGFLLLADLCGLPGLTEPASLDSCSSKTPCFIAGLSSTCGLLKYSSAKQAFPGLLACFLGFLHQ